MTPREIKPGTKFRERGDEWRLLWWVTKAGAVVELKHGPHRRRVTREELARNYRRVSW